MNVGGSDLSRTGRGRKLRAATAVVVLALSAYAHAGDREAGSVQLAVGDVLPVFHLKDQHGNDAAIDPSTRQLLLTRDMDGGGLVKEALAQDGAARLSAAKTAYLSDVSAMPGPIRSMFALPAIRKRPYRVVLDETGAATASMPYQKGAVTVLSLEDGKIESISFATGLDAVLARLAPAPAP